jgi:hypothetical protein
MEEKSRYQELIDFIDKHPGCLTSEDIYHEPEPFDQMSFEFEVGYEF